MKIKLNSHEQRLLCNALRNHARDIDDEVVMIEKEFIEKDPDYHPGKTISGLLEALKKQATEERALADRIEDTAEEEL